MPRWLPRPTGPVLPEDAYEDWAIGHATASVPLSAAPAVASPPRLRPRARWDEAAEHARAMLELDEFDERAHELLVRSLVAAGRHGEARLAADRYRASMAELGVPPAVGLARPVARSATHTPGGRLHTPRGICRVVGHGASRGHRSPI